MREAASRTLAESDLAETAVAALRELSTEMGIGITTTIKRLRPLRWKGLEIVGVCERVDDVPLHELGVGAHIDVSVGIAGREKLSSAFGIDTFDSHGTP